MAYSAPTLSALRVTCLRALRDDGTTFPTAILDDMINEGIAELNRFMPVEMQVVILGAAVGRVVAVPTLQYVFAVEQNVVYNGKDIQNTIPPNDPSIPGWRNGWDFFAGSLDLGSLWAGGQSNLFTRYGTDYTLRVSGYGDRAALTNPATAAELSSLQEEFALRKYVALLGFRLMEHDRSLFQQWLTQANNTDVSPTQLQGMTGKAEAEWERLQKQLKRVRRPAMG